MQNPKRTLWTPQGSVTVTEGADSSAPAYGTVVYNRESWCREARHIAINNGCRPVNRDIDYLYTGIMRVCLQFGYDMQNYLRLSLTYLDSIAKDLFPAGSETDKPVTRKSRRSAQERRQQQVNLSSAIKLIVPPPQAQVAAEERTEYETEAAKATDVSAGPDRFVQSRFTARGSRLNSGPKQTPRKPKPKRR